MKTLYVSDLDGTLLSSDVQISEKSLNILNSLIDEGMLFSAATARSIASVRPITEKLNLNLPVVLMNGVFVCDVKNKKNLLSAGIDSFAAKEIIRLIEEAGEAPFLYCEKGDELLVYFTDLPLPEHKEYYAQRKKLTDKKFCPVNALKIKENETPVYFSFLNFYDKLKPLYDKISKIKEVSCVFYKDSYTEKLWFLEVFSNKSSKPHGIEFIQKITGADRVVVFGDNLNDIPMFEAADECYAVENAREEVKKIATGIIGSNNSDGVAEFILKDFKNKSKK